MSIGIANQRKIDTIYEEVIEIEEHFHTREKWFGLAAVPVGETHRADRVGGATAPFVLTAGNSDFGNWLQILGSSDTPVITAKIKFDAHRVQIVDAERKNAIHVLQLAFGDDQF